MTSHSEALKGLCRVCGEKLRKSSGPTSSSFKCSNKSEFLLEKFSIDIAKDSLDIHPESLCNACYVHPNRRGVSTVIWPAHSEINCEICERVAERKKGGRPKKGARGRKPGKTLAAGSATKKEAGVETMPITVDELVSDLKSYRLDDFATRFIFETEPRADFKCPICIQILDRPIETECEHYFCAECIKGVFEASQSKDCPLCKRCVGKLKIPTRMVLRLLAEQNVICKQCSEELKYEDTVTHTCSKRGKKQEPQTPTEADLTIRKIIEEVKGGKLDPAVEKLCSAFVREKMKTSPDGKTVLLKTGGKPLGVVHVPIAGKSSDQVSTRHRLRRTAIIESVGDAVSSGQKDLHLVASLKKKNKAEREELLRQAIGKELVLQIPEGEANAMMGDLGLTWNKLNKLRRWFREWNVKLESEKKQRLSIKETFGDELDGEMLPLEHSDRRGHQTITYIKETPCVFVKDLKDKILKFIDENERVGALTWHDGNIPEDSLFIKIGGDHGKGSMKMEFQLANVIKPNSSKKTVVLSIFEGKDTRNNLKLVLGQHAADLEELTKATWSGKKIVLFLFGDYELLCKLLGISGASGRHPCLWCTVTAQDMKLPKEQRGEVITRSLDNLKESLRAFQVEGGGDIKKAKKFFNVIQEPIVNIPIEQICTPGLHISLGLFLKFFDMMIEECAVLDEKIAWELSNSSATEQNIDSDLNEHVTNLKNAAEHNRTAQGLEDEASTIEGYMTNLMSLDANNSMQISEALIAGMMESIKALREKAEKERTLSEACLTATAHARHSGPICKAIEAVLQSINVKRQAYHSHSFVGNHVDTCLKDKNILVICSAVTDTTENLVSKTELLSEARETSHKFSKLFSLYACCHKRFNSATVQDEKDLDQLETNIRDFMAYYREQFPDSSCPPKMHMLEEHIVPFIRRWKFPLGFFGEQGGESIHHELARLEQDFSGVKPATARLKQMLLRHYLVVNPTNRAMIPEVKKRNLKRNRPQETDDNST